MKVNCAVKVRSNAPRHPGEFWTESVEAEIPIRDFLMIADSDSLSFQIKDTRDTIEGEYFEPLQELAAAARGEM
jgi:hypothetical protein